MEYRIDQTRPGISAHSAEPLGSVSGERREFRVEIVSEGALGTLFLGSSRLPTSKMEEVLNRYGTAGWDVSFMLIERRRMFLFWTREAAVITFSRTV